MPTVTPHIIVRNAGEAAAWYERALGAATGSRIELPDGRYMQIELRFGDSRVMIADEFPELGAVSPQTLGGTYGALTISVTDADAAWQRALDAGATDTTSSPTPSGANATAKSSTPTATAGASPRRPKKSTLKKSHDGPQPPSANPRTNQDLSCDARQDST